MAYVPLAIIQPQVATVMALLALIHTTVSQQHAIMEYVKLVQTPQLPIVMALRDVLLILIVQVPLAIVECALCVTTMGAVEIICIVIRNHVILITIVHLLLVLMAHVPLVIIK